MRKALIVGIDDYPTSPLTASVADANNVDVILGSHGDGSPNFDNKVMTGSVTRRGLRRELKNLFNSENEIALFYFSGHGTITPAGGMIVTVDAEDDDEGITMAEIMSYANKSKAQNNVIILDCCYSGALGTSEITDEEVPAELKSGITVLTASTSTEEAVEIGGQGGVFTSLLLEALMGGAADVRGNVTPGSLYAYIDEALGAWKQRPMFKTNVKSFVKLRIVQPKVELSVLRELPEYFPSKSSQHELDPAYEPERSGEELAGTPLPDPVKNAIFADLQSMVKASLIVPVDAPHMWHAAMNSTACRLTAMGKQYWRLAKERKI